MWNSGNLNHFVEPFSGILEPWNLYSWNLGTCKNGTFMWNVAEPELEEWNLYEEPWGT